MLGAFLCILDFGMIDKIRTWLNGLYLQLTGVDEPPAHVAFSFAIGVFLGILPFTGVLAAIAISFWLKLNKPAAVLGSAVTNTWLGLITLGLAVKIGAFICRLDWVDLNAHFQSIIKDFTWSKLNDAQLLKIILAVGVGYIVISLILAAVSFCLAYAVIHWHRKQFTHK